MKPVKKKIEGVRERATELFNSLPEADRKKKAGLGYSLAQLVTIAHIRKRNKDMFAREDRELAEWAKGIERWVEKEYLAPKTLLEESPRLKGDIDD